MKRKVMVFGTFDIFHPGHRNFFRQAKKYGDYLTVVVARDKTVVEVKKKKAVNNEKKRLEKVENSKLADKVILGSLSDKYRAIKKCRPDVICLGYDQKYFIKGMRSVLKKSGLENTKIVRLKPHKSEIYKTTRLLKSGRNL